METSQDVVIGSTWAPARPQKPTKPSIMITNEVLVSRQAVPDQIAIPSEKAILSPSWVVTGLIVVTVAIVSEAWRIDMQFSITPVRVSLTVFAIALAILAYSAHLNIQESKHKFEKRKEVRNAPVRDLKSAPVKLTLVA